MTFTLIMAVTAAVAATMGYLAARRKGENGEEEEKDPKDGPPSSSSKKKSDPKLKAESKSKADPKGKAESKGKAAIVDPKAAFAGLPLSLGDVVSDHADERWLAGALLAREDGRVFAALFLAPEGNKHSAVAAFAAPRKEIFWMEPVELSTPEEPPATIELNGIAMRRKGRIPVTVERFGQGAPQVAEEALWAVYEGGGRDVAVVITSQGRTYAWAGRRLDEEEYDRLGEG